MTACKILYWTFNGIRWNIVFLLPCPFFFMCWSEFVTKLNAEQIRRMSIALAFLLTIIGVTVWAKWRKWTLNPELKFSQLGVILAYGCEMAGYTLPLLIATLLTQLVMSIMEFINSGSDFQLKNSSPETVND